MVHDVDGVGAVNKAVIPVLTADPINLSVLDIFLYRGGLPSTSFKLKESQDSQAVDHVRIAL